MCCIKFGKVFLYCCSLCFCALMWVWVLHVLFCFFTGGPGRGGLHHEWQPAAAEEEQEEVEATVVPPQRQGALHLHSPWGEGAQSLPTPAPKLPFTPVAETPTCSLRLSSSSFLKSIQASVQLGKHSHFQAFLLVGTTLYTNGGILCALSVSVYASQCCKSFLKAWNSSYSHAATVVYVLFCFKRCIWCPCSSG